MNKQVIEQVKEFVGEVNEKMPIETFLDFYHIITKETKEATASQERWHEFRLEALKMAHDRVQVLFKNRELSIPQVLGEAKEIADQYVQYLMTGHMGILNEELDKTELINWIKTLPEEVSTDSVLRSLTYNYAGHLRTQAAYLIGLATIQLGSDLFNPAEVAHQLEQLDQDMLEPQTHEG